MSKRFIKIIDKRFILVFSFT